MSFAAVISDLDGVLVDSMPEDVEADVVRPERGRRRHVIHRGEPLVTSASP